MSDKIQKKIAICVITIFAISLLLPSSLYANVVSYPLESYRIIINEQTNVCRGFIIDDNNTLDKLPSGWTWHKLENQTQLPKGICDFRPQAGRTSLNVVRN